MVANRDRAVTTALEWYEGIAVDRHEVDSLADYIERAIDAACAEAVAAEREACAKIAEDDDFIIAGRAYATAEDIAKRIRARSTVKPEPQIPMRNLPRASAKLDKDGK